MNYWKLHAVNSQFHSDVRRLEFINIENNRIIAFYIKRTKKKYLLEDFLWMQNKERNEDIPLIEDGKFYWGYNKIVFPFYAKDLKAQLPKIYEKIQI